MRLRVGRIVVGAIAVEALTKGAAQTSAEQLGYSVGPIAGFVLCLLGGYWVARRVPEGPLRHGLALGLVVAAIDSGILLASDTSFQPVFAVSNVGRLIAGALGGFLAGGFTRESLPLRWIVLGALVVGTLDILNAFVFFGLRGVPLIAIPQSVASGLLGRAAYRGELVTAALGMLLHFGISFAVVSVYYAASRWLPALARQPLVFGPPYGLVVYGVMNYVVLPLSAAVTGAGPKPTVVVVNGLLIHMVGVGLPAALFAARARRRADAV